jgi:hypothetical protein
MSDEATHGMRRAGARSLRANVRGAVFVEFLIAFLPVYVCFLCVCQLGLLFTVKLVTEHAALNGARALAVVGGDEDKRYPANEKKNKLVQGGERMKAVRSAVILTFAPLILNGTIQDINVVYPRPDDREGTGQTGTIALSPMTPTSISKVRVRVEASAGCRLALAGAIACRTLSNFLDPTQKFNVFIPTVRVRAEAIFPYQGASYDYPP